MDLAILQTTKRPRAFPKARRFLRFSFNSGMPELRIVLESVVHIDPSVEKAAECFRIETGLDPNLPKSGTRLLVMQACFSG